jgi:hypothetical protein
VSPANASVIGSGGGGAVVVVDSVVAMSGVASVPVSFSTESPWTSAETSSSPLRLFCQMSTTARTASTVAMP